MFSISKKRSSRHKTIEIWVYLFVHNPKGTFRIFSLESLPKEKELIECSNSIQKIFLEISKIFLTFGRFSLPLFKKYSFDFTSGNTINTINLGVSTLVVFIVFKKYLNFERTRKIFFKHRQENYGRHDIVFLWFLINFILRSSCIFGPENIILSGKILSNFLPSRRENTEKKVLYILRVWLECSLDKAELKI